MMKYGTLRMKIIHIFLIILYGSCVFACQKDEITKPEIREYHLKSKKELDSLISSLLGKTGKSGEYLENIQKIDFVQLIKLNNTLNMYNLYSGCLPYKGSSYTLDFIDVKEKWFKSKRVYQKPRSFFKR